MNQIKFERALAKARKEAWQAATATANATAGLDDLHDASSYGLSRVIGNIETHCARVMRATIRLEILMDLKSGLDPDYLMISAFAQRAKMRKTRYQRYFNSTYVEQIRRIFRTLEIPMCRAWQCKIGARAFEHYAKLDLDTAMTMAAHDMRHPGDVLKGGQYGI